MTRFTRSVVTGSALTVNLLSPTGTATLTSDYTLAPARPGELQRSALAVERARLDLGWKAATGLTEGISTVCDWIRAETPDRAAF